MRISDWSSDVCSSDLGLDPARDAERGPQREGIAARDEGSKHWLIQSIMGPTPIEKGSTHGRPSASDVSPHIRCASADESLEVLSAIPTARTPGWVRQFGRASVRERVCQDG